MNLLARIERLEALAEDLHENLASTGDQLRLIAETLEFPYEKLLQIWRREFDGRPLDYRGSLLLGDAVQRAKTACQTSGVAGGRVSRAVTLKNHD